MHKKLLLSYLYLAVMFLAQLFMTRSITQNLGIEIYGVWAILISIQTYLFAVDSGFSSSVTTYANVFIERGDNKSVRNLLSTNIALLTLIFSIIFFVLLFLSAYISDYYSYSDKLSIFPDWNSSITIVLINVYILSIIGIFSNYLIATYRIEISKIFQIIHIIFYASFVYIAADRGFGIKDLLILVAITSLFYLLSIVLYIKLNDRHILPRSFFFFDKKIYQKISSFIYNTFILAIASRVQFYTDVLVIGGMIGLSSAGIFDINNKIPFYSTYIFSAFVAIYYPVFTRRYHKLNFKGLEDLFLSVQNYSVVLGIGACVVLFFYGEIYINYWVGEGMFAGTNIFVLLIFSMFMHSIYGPSAIALQAIGINRKLMKFEVIAALINIILSLLLVIPLGIVGVVLGTIVAQVIALFFIYIHLLRILKVSLKSFVRETLLPILLHMSLIFFIFYFSSEYWYYQQDLTSVLISSAAIMLLTLIIFVILEKVLFSYRIKLFMSVSNIYTRHDVSLIGKEEE